MTLPVTGNISISMISTEFSRGNNLNSYRGTYFYNSNGYFGYFSTGTITLNDFHDTQNWDPAPRPPPPPPSP